MENDLDSRSRKQEFFWYSLAFILAASLRFIHLGTLPLGESEANQALQALALSKGTVATIGGQPGYVAFTWLLFSVFSASGFWALFWPALFGTTAVFLPLLFKKWLGRNGSILLAFLLALDAGMTALSRNAGSSMIAVVSLLAAFGFLINQKSIPAGIFAGLALLCGTPVWPGLIISGIVLVIYRFSFSDESKRNPIFSGVDWKIFVISLFATIILAGTCFLIHPTVISGLGSGFYDYFHSFAEKGGTSVGVMLLGLLFCETLTLPLAAWGLIIGIKKKDLLVELLGYAVLLSAAILLLNPSRGITGWIWTIIPMIFLAARGADDLLGRLAKQELIVTTIQATLTVLLIVFSFLNLIATLDYQQMDAAAERDAVLEVILPIAFLIIVTILLGWGWSMKAAKQGLVIGLTAILLFVTLGTAWKSAGLGPRPENELWRNDPLPTGSGLLTQTTNQLSLLSNGQETRIDIVIENMDSDALRWSLRDYDKLSEEPVLGDTETPSIIITSSEMQVNSAASYRGEEIHWTSSPDYDNMTASNWLEWFFARKTIDKAESILLWARNDLFKG